MIEASALTRIAALSHKKAQNAQVLVHGPKSLGESIKEE